MNPLYARHPALIAKPSTRGGRFESKSDGVSSRVKGRRQARRRRYSIILPAAVIWAGCMNNEPSPTVRDRLAAGAIADEASPADTNNAASSRRGDVPAGTGKKADSAGGRPVALVNGRPVDRAALVSHLIESRGLLLLQQMILLEAVAQETARRNVEVTDADIEQEYKITIDADRFNGKDKGHLNDERREQMIQDWLRSRGLSRAELDLAMRRQAHLRKLCAPRVRITEEMLRREYDVRHGRRLEVRHLQLAAPRMWPPIESRLRQGEDFEKLVREFSQNTLTREKGGLMPPFGTKDDPTVPPIFAKVASELQVGDVSKPFDVEGSHHVIRLERIIEPDGADFEDVRPQLEAALRARLEANEMQRTGERLLMNCRIQIEDAVLRKQYTERLRVGEIVGPPLSAP